MKQADTNYNSIIAQNMLKDHTCKSCMFGYLKNPKFITCEYNDAKKDPKATCINWKQAEMVYGYVTKQLSYVK
jgi:hypothetical protein